MATVTAVRFGATSDVRQADFLAFALVVDAGCRFRDDFAASTLASSAAIRSTIFGFLPE